MSQATLTRRGFVKSTAAMGAVAALGISAADSLTAVDPAHADEASDVKIYKTSCRASNATSAASLERWHPLVNRWHRSTKYSMRQRKRNIL